ncbi:cytochrome P450 2A12-like [Haemaphysalis longicornis]
MDQVSCLNWVHLCWALALLFLLLWQKRRRSFVEGMLPPGPKGLPVIGHLLHQQNVFDYTRIMELAKQYGPVISFQIGSKQTIFLNNFKSIKEVMTRKGLLFRSENTIFGQPKFKGVTFLNGDDGSVNRKFFLRVLGGVDIEKKVIADNFEDELKRLRKRIAELSGVPVNADPLLKSSISNNIAALVFGRRFNMEDERHRLWFEKLGQLDKLVQPKKILFRLPNAAVKIAELLPFTTSRKMKVAYDQLELFIKEEIQRHQKDGLLGERHQDFVCEYLKQMQDHQQIMDSKFTDTNLLGNIIALFGAGVNNVKKTMHWLLLICADNRDTIQRRIYEEVDRVIGQDRFPQREDMSQMPFTMATIWETYRWRTPGVFPLPRECHADNSYSGYVIPKGSTVIANIAAVHQDPTFWHRPEEFWPERFIDEDGFSLKPKPPVLMPFSVGGRMCPAQWYATTQVFMFVTSLLQKFFVLPPDGKRIILEPDSLVTNNPRVQELRFILR